LQLTEVAPAAAAAVETAIICMNPISVTGVFMTAAIRPVCYGINKNDKFYL
jgi:hypothetical protein